MTDDNWRRDIPRWNNALDLAWGVVPELRVSRGVDGRVISRLQDIEESATMMLRLPAGWTFAPPQESGTLEIFVVEGSLMANGRRLGVGGFVAIPGGRGGAELASPDGALVLAFWNQFGLGDCYPNEDIHIQDTRREKWALVEAPGIPHGTFFKPLRTPFFSESGFGGVAGNLTLIASLPNFHTCDGEHHDDVWEELIGLSGDLCFPDRGSGGPGTVVNNPAWFHHGPYGTQRGHYAVMHALHPIRVNPVHIEGRPEGMEHYHDTDPLFGEPHWTHQWDEHVARRRR